MKLPVEALRHAEKEYPRECCGLLVAGKYRPCRNIAGTPGQHFVIDPADYKAAMRQGEIQAVVHSHPDYPAMASEADRLGCEESGLPWAIIPVTVGVADEPAWISPMGADALLIGREFIHGVHDCLAIILDYYRRELGIDLGTYDREDGWWDAGKDYYRELLPKAGFRQVSEPRQGDVILMQIRSPVPNHAGIYLEDGTLQSEPEHYPAPQSILHHLYGRDSRRDPYGGYWLEKTVSIWRHETQDN
ncbi:C40 family peptidase [Halopseudomonas sp. SMJS2]|uniref:C40 family peptidase n=1 Tax=Halopseudomonas sp. SMJS2 TaxID=3041098 RepID=UPI0024534824|nr:C40 family peptidase [Halopseudomonas sp. SMJS2]WGK60497.1 C40 family peptidase [Halopseudomonas sp. SMJS2]